MMSSNGQHAAEEDTVRLSSGVVFRLKPPSMMAITHRIASLEAGKPTPPLNWIEDKGREEVNDADPEYVRAVNYWYRDLGEAVTDVMVHTGTELLEAPEGMLRPDGEEFSDWMEALGIPASSNQFERYIQWVKYVAVRHRHDWERLRAAVMQQTGVSEQQVAQMGLLFQGEQDGKSSDRGPDQGRDTDGDRARASRTGTGSPLRTDGDGDGVQTDAETVDDGPGGVGEGHADSFQSRSEARAAP